MYVCGHFFLLSFLQVTNSIEQKKEELNGISSPKKDDHQVEKTEKSGLLASMLLEKKESNTTTNMVNGDIEQYKKMNGNKRPASTEPHDDVSTPKKPHMETLKSASNGDSSATSPPMNNSGGGNLQSIPEGSQMSTTAGGQQVVTTPDGKQMIVKMTANGSPMVIGTIEATPTGTPSPPPTATSAVTTMSPAPASPVPQNQQPQTPPPSGANSRPHVNGQVNGNSNSSLSPESPKSNSSTSSTSATSPPTSSTGSSLSVTTVPKPNPALPFLCEWQGCMKAFKTPKEVEKHAIATHCPLGSDDIPCLWQRCDAMKRKRFSLMTHLQDRHCHPQVCHEKQGLDSEERCLTEFFFYFSAYETNGSATSSNGTTRQIGCAFAPRSPASSRIRSQCCPSCH